MSTQVCCHQRLPNPQHHGCDQVHRSEEEEEGDEAARAGDQAAPQLHHPDRGGHGGDAPRPARRVRAGGRGRGQQAPQGGRGRQRGKTRHETNLQLMISFV